MAVIELRPVTGLIDPDPELLARSVKYLEIEHGAGEPAVMRCDLDVWDEESNTYDPVASQVLDHYDAVEPWINGECRGLFYVEEDEAPHGADGVVRQITAYDAMRRLNRSTDSLVYTNVRKQDAIVLDLAKRHELAADVSADEMRTLPAKKYDIVKKLGDTDLQLLHRVAQAEGLGLPFIRYTAQPGRPGGSSLNRPGTETLVVRRMALVGNPIELAVTRPSGEGGDLAEFVPRFDTGDLPEAVEVVAWDKDAGKPFRVTVTASPSGPVVESILDRDITRKERDRVQPGKGDRDSGDVILRALGRGREDVDTGIVHKVGKKRIRARVQYREILTDQSISGVSDAVALAKAWMAARIVGYMTCRGSVLPNMEGAEKIGVGSVVFISGALPSYNGHYFVERTIHRWDERGHVVDFEGRRLLVDFAPTVAPSRLPGPTV